MTETNSENAKSLQHLDTLQYADSVEWCPLPRRKNFLICGTYQLREGSVEPVKQDDEEAEDTTPSDGQEGKESQVRDGGVTMYSLTCADGQRRLEQVDRLDLCGVLDMKWRVRSCESEGQGEDTPVAMFGLVDAEGKMQVVKMNDESGKMAVFSDVSLTESSLGLSLGWGPQATLLAGSDSAGHITVAELGQGASLQVVNTWKAHDYEAWITAFHNTDGNILYSGADDCRLKRWDLRDTSRPTMTSRRHSMGVCSIQSHPVKEHIVATGSYDEQLHVWDDRQMKCPLTSGEIGGGVWRIKWDPWVGDAILTATMYNGTHIVDTSDLGVSALSIVARYTDHNLAYGADWCRMGRAQGALVGEGGNTGRAEKSSNDNDIYLISTCSFYDHALHLWEWHKETIK